jgi:hypothetical protein
VTKAGHTVICKLARKPMRLTSRDAHEAGYRSHRQSARNN